MTTADTLKLESPETPATEKRGVFACSDLLAVSYGIGNNSTALLCGLYERGIRPDVITTADPKGEWPRTYIALEKMKQKVREWWGLEITVVKKLYQGEHEGLEAECLRKKMLPGLAYGTRSCSIKHKGELQDKELERRWKAADGIVRFRKAIGYHAGEGHRVKNSSTNPDVWWPWYPLIEWQWWPQDCLEAMCRHGIKPPGKSACFFCPASKPSEVIAMAKEAPELMERALAIEDASQETNTTKRGLGGENNLWRDWLAMDASQQKMPLDIEPMHLPCGCYEDES